MEENLRQYPAWNDDEGVTKRFPDGFWEAFWAEQTVINAFTKQVQQQIEAKDPNGEIMNLHPPCVYVQTRRAFGGAMAVGTDGCVGVGECQFIKQADAGFLQRTFGLCCDLSSSCRQ